MSVHAAREAAWIAKLRCEGDAEEKREAAMAAWDAVMEGRKGSGEDVWIRELR